MPSKDPVQQKLRDHKKNWNDETSDFISKLIAFKRGLNGRGDAKYNLPVSKIQNAFAPIMHQTLDQLTSEYEKLSKDALSILSEQDSYSKSRKQKNASVDVYNLISNAGKLSRFWSYVTAPFSDEEYAKYRISLLRSMAEIDEDLISMQESLVSSNVASIKKATTYFDKIDKKFVFIKKTISYLKEKSGPKLPEHLQEIERIKSELEFMYKIHESNSKIVTRSMLDSLEYELESIDRYLDKTRIPDLDEALPLIKRIYSLYENFLRKANSRNYRSKYTSFEELSHNIMPSKDDDRRAGKRSVPTGRKKVDVSEGVEEESGEPQAEEAIEDEELNLASLPPERQEVAKKILDMSNYFTQIATHEDVMPKLISHINPGDVIQSIRSAFNSLKSSSPGANLVLKNFPTYYDNYLRILNSLLGTNLSSYEEVNNYLTSKSKSSVDIGEQEVLVEPITPKPTEPQTVGGIEEDKSESAPSPSESASSPEDEELDEKYLNALEDILKLKDNSELSYLRAIREGQLLADEKVFADKFAALVKRIGGRKGKLPSDKIKIKEDITLSAEIINLYNQILNHLKEEFNLPNAQSFKEIKENQPKKSEGYSNTGLIKSANVATRWLKKQIHKLSPFDKSSPFRLEAFDKVEDSREIASEIMSSLEEDIDFSYIENKLIELERSLRSIKKIIDVLMSYYSSAEFQIEPTAKNIRDFVRKDEKFNR